MTPQEQYVEFAIGDHTNRGQVCTLEQFALMAERARVLGKPVYRSVYVFGVESKEHFRMYKTIKGFGGAQALPSLVLDLDRGADTDEEINQKAKEIYRKCCEDFPWFSRACNIWYSGTGYHFTLPNVFGFQPSPTLHEIAKPTIMKHFPWADAGIYDRTHMIRANYSLNQKSNRYKVLLDPATFPYMDAAQVIEFASQIPTTTDTNDHFTFFDVPLENQIVHKPMVYNPQIKPKTETNGLITCVQRMFQEGETVGSRHEKALRIASAWRRQGIPEVGIVAILQSYVPSFSYAECQRIARDVFKGDYRYGCDDEVMSRYCDPKCLFHKEKNYDKSILAAKSVESNFRKFVLSDAEERSFDLRSIYRMPKPYKFYPGELVLLWGDTKLGKSAWAQNIAVALKNKRILYLSLEVQEALIYRRFIQIAHKLTKVQVMEYYKLHTNTLSNAISHISFGCESPNLEDIPRLIVEMDIDITFVDVIDMLQVSGIKQGDEYAQLLTIARRLKEIAKKTDTIIFGIHHVSKGAIEDKDGRAKPLTVHSGKSSSALEQKADKILGIEGNPLSPLRTIRSLGSRDEENFTLKFNVDWSTFTFNQAD